MNAVDFVVQLSQDEEYLRKKEAFNAELQQRTDVWRKAEQPIVADLRVVGWDVDSVWDLVNTSDPYYEALPVLMDHLERGGMRTNYYRVSVPGKSAYTGTGKTQLMRD